MEKKKFSIELPKGGMSDLAKRTISKPRQKLPTEACYATRFLQTSGAYPQSGHVCRGCSHQGDLHI